MPHWGLMVELVFRNYNARGAERARWRDPRRRLRNNQESPRSQGSPPPGWGNAGDTRPHKQRRELACCMSRNSKPKGAKARRSRAKREAVAWFAARRRSGIPDVPPVGHAQLACFLSISYKTKSALLFGFGFAPRPTRRVQQINKTQDSARRSGA